MRKGKRRIEHETDRRNQIESLHVHFPQALRRGGMNEYRKCDAIDLLPHRSKLRIDKILTVNGAKHHDADGTFFGCAHQLGLGVIGVLPGQ